MKVLIVHPCKGFYGGAEEVVYQLHRYLISKETTPFGTVRVVLKDMPKELKVKLKGWGYFEDTHTWRDFRSVVQRNTKWADVICCFNFPATLAAFPIKDTPIVWYCNEPPELFTNWWRKPIEAFNRWWVRRSHMKVVVADQYNKNRFSRLYGIEPKILPYGIDYNFWSQGKTSPRNEGRLRILQVGTITSYKNQLESVTTLYELVKQGIDATLTLAGSFNADPKYFLKIHNYIKSASREHPNFWKRTSYTGQVNHEEVRKLLNSHDVLVHPVKEQGGWLVPFEAMCAGLPVVVTPSFTASSMIEKNKLGIVTYKLHEGIQGALEGNFSPAGQWVKETLTWEKYGEGMVKIFEEAIDG